MPMTPREDDLNDRKAHILFVQFLNDQMLRNNRVNVERASSSKAQDEYSALLKICLLMNVTRLVVPTIDTVQSPLFPSFSNTDEFRLYLKTSRVIFAGSAGSAEDWLPNKKRHFSRLKKYPEYFERNLVARLTSFEPFFQRRLRSSTRDVARGWARHLENIFSADRDVLWIESQIRQSLSTIKIWRHASFQDRLLMAPTKLDGQALIWDILKQEDVFKLPSSYYDELEEEFQHLLSFIWIGSHCDEYSARILYNIPYLGRMDCGFAEDNPEDVVDYQRSTANLHRVGLFPIISKLNADEVAVLATTQQWQLVSSRLSLWGQLPSFDAQFFERMLETFRRVLVVGAKTTILRRTMDGLERTWGWMEKNHPEPQDRNAIGSRPWRGINMLFQVCIFLPKFEEWRAFVDVFAPGQSRDSIFDEFPNAKLVRIGEIEVLLIQAGKTLEAMAASSAAILDRVRPKLVILGGICGARNDFRLGDVLVANYVSHLGYGVSRSGKFTRRPQNDAAVATRIHEHAEYVAHGREWNQAEPCIDVSIPGLGMISGGQAMATCDILFGSSNILVDDPSTTLAAEMLNALPEAKAVEMEAAGLIQSLRRFSDAVEWIMIRGISDLPLKHGEAERPLLGPEIRAQITSLASINCAKFCKALLSSLYEKRAANSERKI